MKKIITILLLAALPLSFVACNDSDAQIAALEERIEEMEDNSEHNDDAYDKIVGKWVFESDSINFSYQFNSDFTGKLISTEDESNTQDMRWSYDPLADVYLIYTGGKAYVYYAYLDADGNLSFSGQTAQKAN